MLKNGDHIRFLSSPAQDFIEEATRGTATSATVAFLSSPAQDFIEERNRQSEPVRPARKFLSSLAQDFIEDRLLQVV